MLGVELLELWRAGRVQLPALAGIYERAAEELSLVPHDEAEWTSLRRQLISVLATAAAQIAEAADGVTAAVARYEQADEAAAQELRTRLVNDLPNGAQR
ncbi:hypothetical protein ACQP00_40625 [Dactylosporangium sp. CS-047395]|uniref:hypothetical protein n=1 Tax=Dactylosporangium sp. CS-047395 TaxID=3239936 RepID=UPI003D8ADA3F